MTNELLWERFLKGDKDALSDLFKHVFDDIYGYGIRLTGKPEIVNDSIQDLFLKLWKNRSNLGPVESIKPYLLKAIRRQIINNLRMQQRYVNFEEVSDNFFEIEYSPEDFVVKEQGEKEARKKLVSMLNQLTERQKEAIYLRYIYGYDFDTIAEIMLMNIQSVRNTIHKGLLTLREMFPVFIFFISKLI